MRNEGSSTVTPLLNTPVEVAEWFRDLKFEAQSRFNDLAVRIAAGERPSLEVIAPILATACVGLQNLEFAVARVYSQRRDG